jgi:hypothetical protein
LLALLLYLLLSPDGHGGRLPLGTHVFGLLADLPTLR